MPTRLRAPLAEIVEVLGACQKWVETALTRSQRVVMFEVDGDERSQEDEIWTGQFSGAHFPGSPLDIVKSAWIQGMSRIWLGVGHGSTKFLLPRGSKQSDLSCSLAAGENIARIQKLPVSGSRC